jgi:hypothetical protein
MNTELQSHINSTCCTSDPDAKALLTAAGVTDEVATTEITKHVNRLKYYEIWDEMDVIYLFPGTTASQQKFNIKNVADTDAAFRLTMNGGVTHSSTGIKFNGVNGFANTYYNPATQGFSNTNAHIGIYVVSPEITDSVTRRLTGVSTSTDSQPIYIIPRTNPNVSNFGFGGTTGPAQFTQSDARGFYQLNRNGLVTKGSKDGIVVTTQTSTISTITSLDFYLGCGRIPGFGNYRYSDSELGYVSFGNGLTDEKARIHNYLVNDLMTKLGR